MEDTKKAEKEIEEYIRIWEKNRQALFNMAGLMFELRRSNNINVAMASLFYSVLDNLQDIEVTINYKGKSLMEEYDALYDSLSETEKYYRERNLELSKRFQNMRSRNMDGYLFKSATYFESINNHGEVRFYNSSYNLMQRLAYNNKINWIREILTSKIPKSVRISMLDDVIKYKNNSLNDLLKEDSHLYPDSIYPAILIFDDSDEHREKCNREMMELFTEWKQVYANERRKYKIVNEYPINKIKFFQNNGIIDFTHDTIYYDESRKEVAVAAQIYSKNKNILSIEPFYDNESYKQLSTQIRENTDKFLIWEVVEHNEFSLMDLIELRNFEITDKNVSEIIAALSVKNEVSSTVINYVCTAIEKKSKTKKEYKKALSYTKLIKESLDPDKLKEKRQELVSRLSRMNDVLQETVPGKAKIKNIDFNNSKK